jgi:TRAP-type C4-dicarboxylate transport system substrate-binding protein
MKTFIRIALVTMLMSGFSIVSDAGLAHAKSKYKITFGHVEPIHSSTHEAALKFKEIVEEESRGEIEVFIHPSSELGSGPDPRRGLFRLLYCPAPTSAAYFQKYKPWKYPFYCPKTSIKRLKF